MQEKSLASLEYHYEELKSTKSSLELEKGTDLLSQLSSEDQQEVDRLNDEIKKVIMCFIKVIAKCIGF